MVDEVPYIHLFESFLNTHTHTHKYKHTKNDLKNQWIANCRSNGSHI